MNYILQMQNFYYLAERDKRLKPWHIALYFVLFNTWHRYHFAPLFRISHGPLMNASRIGSKKMLVKTLRQLHEYGYIVYQHELHKGHHPKVTVIRLTNHETVKNQLNLFPEGGNGNTVSGGTGNAVSAGNGTRNDAVPGGRPTMQEILHWFDKRHATQETALTFCSTYDWTKGRPPFRNWQEAAENWLSNLNTKFYIQRDTKYEENF